MESDGLRSRADPQRSEIIAQLNDKLRQQGVGGRVVVTRGVMALAGYNPVLLAAGLASYDGFDQGSDPYDERDFGKFRAFGAELFWKIDYYFDGQLEYGSPDPSDPAVTVRVLTVMLTCEY